MSRRPLALLTLAISLVGAAAEARVVRVAIERREPLLGGKAFGLAGPYETIVGTVEIALAPALRQNQAVVDLGLAPRNERGEVVFTADLYLHVSGAIGWFVSDKKVRTMRQNKLRADLGDMARRFAKAPVSVRDAPAPPGAP